MRLIRAILPILAVAGGLYMASRPVQAATVGSNYTNITFTQSWQTPSGTTALASYFAAPGYVTLLELWAPG
ncbi:MAG: hypothetical protein KF754_10855 [Planctomycetes bacterium]|nr:hypothetical protein [Planctomycetota bacterium]